MQNLRFDFVTILLLASAISLLGWAVHARTCYPVYSDQVFRNPGMGWLPYVFDRKDRRVSNATDLCSAISLYFDWKELNPEEGSYDWTELEAFLRVHSPMGRRIVLTVYLCNPHRPPAGNSERDYQVPMWLIEKPGMSGRWFSKFCNDHWDCGGGKSQYEPDYVNPVFQNAWGEFLRAMNDRYRRSRLWQQGIESICISSYGYYGEWWSDYEWPNDEIRRSTLEFLIDQMCDAFPRDQVPTPELFINPTIWDDLDKAEPLGIKHAQQTRGVGMICRGIGLSPETPRLLSGGYAEWITGHRGVSFLIGEWGSATGGIDNEDLGIGSIEAAVKQSLRYGSRYQGWFLNRESYEHKGSRWPLDYLESETGERLEDFYARRCGYRFWISRADYPDTVGRGCSFFLTTQWTQRGVGGMYGSTHYKLRAYLEKGDRLLPLNTDPTFDGRDLPPAEYAAYPSAGPFDASARFSIPADIEPGKYDLKIALVCPAGRPAINLAMEGKDTDDVHAYGRYLIGPIVVAENPGEPCAYDNRSLAAGVTPGTLVTEAYDGWYGARVRVGDRDLFLREVGRYYVGGRRPTIHRHEIRVYEVATGNLVCRSSVGMQFGAADVYGFKYGSASGMLKANQDYYVVSSEWSGKEWLRGDPLFAADSVIAVDSVDASVVCAVQSSDLTNFLESGGPGNCFGPVSIRYDIEAK